MGVALTRQDVGKLYRPRQYKPLSLNNPITFGASGFTGATFTLGTGKVDLSVPIINFKFVWKFRITVGTAAFTTITPEAILNLCAQNMQIFGTHTINGPVGPFNMDLTSWAGFSNLMGRRNVLVYISKAGGPLTLDPEPSTPFGTSGFDGSVATFDCIVDAYVPLYPHEGSMGQRASFAYRSEEWKDSLNVVVVPGGQAGNASGSLGAAAATTTVAFAAFGGGGSPTLDIYVQPSYLGSLAPTVVPGLLSRTVTPLSTLVQTTGNDIQLVNFQKRKTGRVFLKTGVQSTSPVFTTLSDGVVTKLGLIIGADKVVKDKIDVFAIKGDMAQQYNTHPIQGYTLLDFLQSGLFDSGYDADQIQEGTTYQLVGDVVGAANQGAIIMQEQIIRTPGGELHNY